MASVRNITIPSSRSLERSAFLKKVYLHLFLAISAFIGLEYVWFSTGIAISIFEMITKLNWLIIMGAFMGVSWLATRFANSSQAKAYQYFGLSLYVFIESLIFVPLLFLAEFKAGGGVIEKAAYITIGNFLMLTALIFFMKVDLIGWGKYLIWGGILTLGAIVSSVIFGFQLGTIFSLAMVGFAGFAILYDTSMILYHYDDESYVSASLQLFASIAMMFWYVLRLLSRR